MSNRNAIILYLVVAVLFSAACYAYWLYEQKPEVIAQRKAERASQQVIDHAADNVEYAKHIVLANLKDPDSAKFHDVRYIGTRIMREATNDQQAVTIEVICGWVNAKNSFGGYTGFKPFATFAGGTSVTMGPEYSNDMDLMNKIEPYNKDCWAGYNPPMRP